MSTPTCAVHASVAFECWDALLQRHDPLRHLIWEATQMDYAKAYQLKKAAITFLEDIEDLSTPRE